MSSDTEQPFDAATDLAELSSRLRTQSARAPGSDTDRVTIRSLEAVAPDELTDLREAAETDHDAPGEFVFVLSRANAELLTEREFDLEDVDALADRLGRPVEVAGEVPDDTILLLAPDAVDGTEIEDPSAIACGIVGTAD